MSPPDWHRRGQVGSSLSVWLCVGPENLGWGAASPETLTPEP